MGMERSVHRKRRNRTQVSYRGGKAGGWGIWLPMGHKAGVGHKASGGNDPGKVFKDPQGTKHTVPNKASTKRDEKKRITFD